MDEKSTRKRVLFRGEKKTRKGPIRREKKPRSKRNQNLTERGGQDRRKEKGKKENNGPAISKVGRRGGTARGRNGPDDERSSRWKKVKWLSAKEGGKWQKNRKNLEVEKI